MKKTKKRDKSQRAYHLGMKSGLKGHSKEMCPYTEDSKLAMWMGGWRQGHTSYLSGYIVED